MTSDEYGNAMKQTVEEEFQDNLDRYEKMKSTVQAYTNKRECSFQDYVYHVLQDQWLRKVFSGAIFVNTNVPEKMFRICSTQNEITELPDDSKQIFRSNFLIA